MALTVPVSSTTLAAAGGLLTLLCLVCQVLYNLFLHPLRHYPGPLLLRATRLGFLFKQVNATMICDLVPYMDKYGPVVRVAPDELAFLDPNAWKDIYGLRTGAHNKGVEMTKYEGFYYQKGMVRSILGENRANHTLLRKNLAGGFSDRGMLEQGPLINKYVSLLIRRLRENCAEPVPATGTDGSAKPRPMDVRSWYNFTTFDIIGDLAFGEPFGCLENSAYHPWVETICKMLQGLAWYQLFAFLGLDGILAFVFQTMFSSWQEQANLGKKKLERYLQREKERQDLISGLVKLHSQGPKTLSLDQLSANAGLLVIAGSETTATLLTGMTYLLLMNPAALEKLAGEVRSSFSSEDDITLVSTNKLTYMLACINESLRCYPPAAGDLPRVVPKGGATIAGHEAPEGTIVSVWQWPMYHSTRYFTDPFAFKPERFLGQNDVDCLRTMEPFSVGPRNCIGRNLAYAEARLIMARILFNFDMELADPNVAWVEKQRPSLAWDKPPLDVIFKPVR